MLRKVRHDHVSTQPLLHAKPSIIPFASNLKRDFFCLSDWKYINLKNEIVKINENVEHEVHVQLYWFVKHIQYG